jgi:hypothetical protein
MWNRQHLTAIVQAKGDGSGNGRSKQQVYILLVALTFLEILNSRACCASVLIFVGKNFLPANSF